MKIAYLGAGAWGFCLASILSGKGYRVASFSIEEDVIKILQKTREHPVFPGVKASGNITFTTRLEEALEGCDIIVESVSSSGIRPVFERLKKIRQTYCPIVITSKGIEQASKKVLAEVVVDILGEENRQLIGALSGPSFAKEVIHGLPTSVVSSSFNDSHMHVISEIFSTPIFRVYPNKDMIGVSFGGALKNVIAIACGIADGLELGNGAKAALITRGLHEIRKLAVANGAKAETLNGLSGLGDLVLTCGCDISRNYQFGQLLAQGIPPQDAKGRVKMVVEGANTCVAALQLAKEQKIQMPIAETVHQIIYDNFPAKEAVAKLMSRKIKQEHL